MMLKKIISVILLTGFAAILVPAGVGAANESSIIVQPSKIEVLASPGQKIAESFSIINRSNYYINYKVSIKSYRQASQDGKLEFYDSFSEPAGDWIIPQYLQIGLKPLETKEIGFVVAVPDNFSGGGHYGSILLESLDKENSAGNFGALVLLTVTGSTPKSSAVAKTVNFWTNPFQKGSPVDFNFKMQNTGNTHFAGQAKLVLKDLFGRNAGDYSAGQLTVYPSTTRLFKWRWENSPKLGLYKAELFLSSSINNDNLKSVDSTWFIIFPWPVALAALIVILAVLLIIKGKKILLFINDNNFFRVIFRKTAKVRAKRSQKFSDPIYSVAIKDLFFKN